MNEQIILEIVPSDFKGEEHNERKLLRTFCRSKEVLSHTFIKCVCKFLFENTDIYEATAIEEIRFQREQLSSLISSCA